MRANIRKCPCMENKQAEVEDEDEKRKTKTTRPSAKHPTTEDKCGKRTNLIKSS
jgi:hypothetical protein